MADEKVPVVLPMRWVRLLRPMTAARRRRLVEASHYLVQRLPHRLYFYNRTGVVAAQLDPFFMLVRMDIRLRPDAMRLLCPRIDQVTVPLLVPEQVGRGRYSGQ